VELVVVEEAVVLADVAIVVVAAAAPFSPGISPLALGASVAEPPELF
jgi:hypothetical protein